MTENQISADWCISR